MEVYDYQVDANGSVRLRSGNTQKVKKGQSIQPTKEMDFSFEYDAKKQEFFLRVGPAGQDLYRISIMDGQIVVKSAECIVVGINDLTKTYMVMEEGLIELKSSEIQLKAETITLETDELTINAASANISVKSLLNVDAEGITMNADRINLNAEIYVNGEYLIGEATGPMAPAEQQEVQADQEAQQAILTERLDQEEAAQGGSLA